MQISAPPPRFQKRPIRINQHAISSKKNPFFLLERGLVPSPYLSPSRPHSSPPIKHCEAAFASPMNYSEITPVATAEFCLLSGTVCYHGNNVLMPNTACCCSEGGIGNKLFQKEGEMHLFGHLRTTSVSAVVLLCFWCYDASVKVSV